MSLHDRQLALARAARECTRRRDEATAAWSKFRTDTERAATPGRIVGAGLVAGFVSGLAAPSGRYAAPLGEKLFRTLLDSAFANVGAAFAAGIAAAGEAGDIAAAQAETPSRNASADANPSSSAPD
jgi:hypothetical protein